MSMKTIQCQCLIFESCLNLYSCHVAIDNFLKNSTFIISAGAPVCPNCHIHSQDVCARHHCTEIDVTVRGELDTFPRPPTSRHLQIDSSDSCHGMETPLSLPDAQVINTCQAEPPNTIMSEIIHEKSLNEKEPSTCAPMTGIDSNQQIYNSDFVAPKSVCDGPNISSNHHSDELLKLSFPEEKLTSDEVLREISGIQENTISYSKKKVS